MTIWSPELQGLSGPKYVAIADAIARDISSGRLAPGTRLPTHRDLADRLSVTVGTVSRAYAEAKRRGLVSGEVGRGTFVRQLAPSQVGFGVRLGAPLRQAGQGDLHAGLDGRISGHSTEEIIDLSFNSPPMAGIEQDLRPALSALANQDRLVDTLRYHPNIGMERHRRAGARWMGYAGMEAEASEVIVTAGAQHAMLLAFSALTQPGDLVLTEALTYPGMSSIARLLRLRLEGIPMDRHGLGPEAFAEACRRGAPKAVYLTPTIQNPTAVSMPQERRREIATIAEAHGVAVVEDDIYAHLVPQPAPPIAAFAPELSIRIDGLSKSIAPGLRIGYLRAPARLVPSFAAALMTTTIMASPVTADIAATVIEDGTAARIIERRRGDIARRQKLARSLLGQYIEECSRPESMHIWLKLPAPWRAEEMVARARGRGVLIASAEPFAVGQSVAPHAVRLSIGAVDDLATLERGLTRLAELLAGSPRLQLTRV